MGVHCFKGPACPSSTTASPRFTTWCTRTGPPACAGGQGAQLAALIHAEWPACRRLLDVFCGIGTQAIGLALQGEDLHTQETRTHALRSRYYAVSTDRLRGLMREAGFEHVRRIDDAFYQPVLVGTQPG